MVQLPRDNSLFERKVRLQLHVAIPFLLVFSGLAVASSGPPTSENAYCGKGNVAKFGNKDGPAELPKSCYYTGLDGTPSPGKQIRVKPDGDLFEAVGQAKCGDTLLLAAGASFEIKQLPKKNCDDEHYITIRTDTPDSKLPAEGSRISPAWAGVASLPGRPAYSQPEGGPAKLMATILLRAVPNTTIGDHYRFIGIEWSTVPGSKADRMVLTDGANHVIFDRNWFHPAEGAEVSKGVMMNGDTRFIAVINSYFNGFNCVARSGACTDASDVGGGHARGSGTIGTLKIYNNFLEASGESIIFGGAGSDTNPEDIEIRRNHLFKPMTWKEGEPGYTPAPSGDPYIVKNNLELKSARRVLIEGNLIENSWGGFTQTGYSVLFTPRNQNGNCPKCLVLDITLRYNWIRNVAAGLQIATGLSTKQGAASADGGRISVHDLIVDSVHNTGWVGKGAFASIGTHDPLLHDVAFDHVTAFTTGPMFLVTTRGEQIINFSVTNSIFTIGGERPDLASAGGGKINCASRTQKLGAQAVLDACFKNYRFAKNIVIGGRGGWPSGTITGSSLEAAGVRPLENGISKNPRLCRAQEAGCKKASSGVAAGTDGKDIGADVDAVEAAIAGVQ